ncbi:uncharacterized protein TNCV_3308851 [Trichonephila clavipes]|nr:uncharacterized protein TNCV_3308851 [Trichonephila clavipes]
MICLHCCNNALPIWQVAAVAEWYRYRIVAYLVTSSSSVPLKTRRVGKRCTLNLSRAETSSHWCGRRGGGSSGVFHVTSPWFKITWSVAKSPRVAEQCDVSIQSINQPDLASLAEKSVLNANFYDCFNIVTTMETNLS